MEKGTRKDYEILFEICEKSEELEEKVEEFIEFVSEKEAELLDYWGAKYPSDLDMEERRILEMVDREREFWERISSKAIERTSSLKVKAFQII
jgi:hypothetical protein